MYYGPRIVSSGLVLCLDAANKRSYPGTGTTWTDLSGNNNNGTLTNGPTFSAGNQGSIVFDGVDDYGTVSNDTTSGTNDFAISTWLYSTESSNNRYILDFGNNGGSLISDTGRYRYYNQTTGTGTLYSDGISYVVNSWYNIVISRISSITYLYSNGISIRNASDTGNIGSWGTTLSVGRWGGGSLYYQGRISNILIYKNKGLTFNEVLQNYNATKTRFGR